MRLESFKIAKIKYYTKNRKKLCIFNFFVYLCAKLINQLVMAKEKQTTIEDLEFDDKNFNRHTEFGLSLVEKSLRQNGAGRSILIDKNNRIIGGNGVVEVAGQIGMNKVRIVESDGTEIIAVKRTDIDLDSKQGREMALADNATGAADLQWDYDQLRQELDEKMMKNYGITIPELKNTEALSAIEYNSCYYEPKEQPSIKLEDCINFDKFNAKVKALDEFRLSDDERKVLTWFCYRFLKIDFESVANYYAFNASEEMKKAMERLRLVLVDGGGRWLH